MDDQRPPDPNIINKIEGNVSGKIFQGRDVHGNFIQADAVYMGVNGDVSAEAYCQLETRRAEALTRLVNAQRAAAKSFPYVLCVHSVPLTELYCEQVLHPIRYQDELAALNLTEDIAEKLADNYAMSDWMLDWAQRQAFDAGPTRERRRPARLKTMSQISRTDIERGLKDARRRVAAGVAARPTASALIDAWSPRHLIIMGDAGQGKTTLALQLVANLAIYRESQITRLGLRVTAAEMVRQPGSLMTAALRAAEAELSHHLEYSTVEFLEKTLSDVKQLLLVVDGLDELTEPHTREHLLQTLRRYMSEPAEKIKILVLTRRLTPSELDSFHKEHTDVYELSDFQPNQFDLFASRWFNQKGEPSVVGRFLADARAGGLSEVVTRPLFATIAAILFTQNGGNPLPGNQHDLLDRLIVELLTSRSVQAGEQEDALLRKYSVLRSTDFVEPLRKLFQQRAELLEHVAYSQIFHSDVSLLAAANDWISQNIDQGLSRRMPRWQAFLIAFLSDTGIVASDGDDVDFIHRSLAEHLGAQLESRSYSRTFDTSQSHWNHIIENACADDSYSITVVLHYGQNCFNPEKFLSWLQEKAGPRLLLAGRLIAEGFPADDSSRRRFLDHLRELMLTAHPDSRDQRWWTTAARIPGEHLRRFIVETAHSGGTYASCALDALCRIVPQLAVEILSDMAQSPLSTNDQRMTSVARMAELGSPFVAQTSQMLELVLRDPMTKITAALSLLRVCAEFLPRQQHRMEHALYLLLTWRELTPTEHILGARALATFSFDRSRKTAISILCSIAQDVVENGNTRLHACVELLTIDPGQGDLVERVSQEVLDDRSSSLVTVIHAYQLMAQVRPIPKRITRQALHRMADDRDMPAEHRSWARQQLKRFESSDLHHSDD